MVLSYFVSFVVDVLVNRLLWVFWVIFNVFEFEYFVVLVVVGVFVIVNILRILFVNFVVWEKMVLIVSYDENGGFFDYVVFVIVLVGIFGEYVMVFDID